MKIHIEEIKHFKFSIDNSLGIIKIEYETPHIKKDDIDKLLNKIISHKNIIKVEDIANLFLDGNEIYIISEKEKFIYSFETITYSKQVFTTIQNNYINYYSILINNKDLFEDMIKPKGKK